MIKEFVLAWEKNKENLKEFLKTHEQSQYSNYINLVELLFDIVVNPELKGSDQYDTDDILLIDDGDYQGTQIFVLHKNTYQPTIEEYVYTNMYYGSCSICDTLMEIANDNYSFPDDEQLEDYMDLCLHLLQKCVFMTDD